MSEQTFTPANRQQRRLMQQLQRRKAAPRRQPRGAAINTMEMARNRATCLTEAELQYMLQPAVDGFDALRQGTALLHHWQSLAQMVTLAVAIEASGIVTGLSEPFAAARAALLAVRARVTSDPERPTWGTSTALRAEEMRAIEEAMRLHRFQAAQLSAGELQRLHRILVREWAQQEGARA